MTDETRSATMTAGTAQQAVAAGGSTYQAPEIPLSLELSRDVARKAAEALRTRIAKDSVEVRRLSAWLTEARAELRRTERLLAALDRIEHPRKRGKGEKS